VASGLWAKVLPGIYRAASTPESWNQKVAAACIWAGEGALVSHRTAAALHALEGIRPPRPGEPIELTVPFGRIRRAPGVLVHRSRRLEHGDKTVIGGIAVTSLARTLIDLSSSLDERRLAVALDSGLARHSHLDARLLRRELRRLRTQGRKISPFYQRLLDERTPDTVRLDSALERRFAAAIRAAGLPRPAAHYDVVENGRRIAEVDFAYPQARLAIQLNGASIHRRAAVWEHDQDQLSDLAAAGWRVVHVTWAQLENDERGVLDRIARALAGERA
jgi:hypothetical protein